LASARTIVLMNDFIVLEEKLKLNLISKPEKIFSIEEQNNWFVASDKINLAPFLSTELL
jgi:hypothetical protein